MKNKQEHKQMKIHTFTKNSKKLYYQNMHDSDYGEQVNITTNRKGFLQYKQCIYYNYLYI